MKLYRSFECGDMLLQYYRTGKLFSFLMIPAGMEDQIRLDLDRTLPESMVQFKLSGTPFPEDSAVSLRNAPCIQSLKFVSQKKTGKTICTSFEYGKKLHFTHVAEWIGSGVRVYVKVKNTSSRTVQFDYLTSFSLGLLSPFQKSGGAGKYFIEQVQSPNRHTEKSAELAGLEVAAGSETCRSMKFGQTGTLPVNQYFPFAGLEDRENGVLWGVQPEAFGAWQLEISRKGERLNLSGGDMDRSWNGWTGSLAPKAEWRTQSAILTCVKGNILDLFNRLEAVPFAEKRNKTIPLIYETDRADAKNLKIASELGVNICLLTREVSKPVAAIKTIRSCGLRPGITCEPETLEEDSQLATLHPDWLLTLDGEPVRVEKKVFLDLRIPEVRNAVFAPLVSLLKDQQISYLRVLASASFSCGCDGPDSPQENQRQYTRAVQTFYEEIRRKLPELTLEFCSAQGQRYSPGFLTCGDAVSFAEMLPSAEIPMVSLDMQMLTHVSDCLVRVPLNGKDEVKAMLHRLASLFLGRPAISGDLTKLSAGQKQMVKDMLDLYAEFTAQAKDGGFSLGHIIGDVRTDPEGWQIYVKTNGDLQCVVFHTFKNAQEKLSFPLEKGFRLIQSVTSDTLKWKIKPGQLDILHADCFEGAVFLFERKP